MPRAQINTKAIRVSFRENLREPGPLPKKISANRALMNRILAYSAIKIRAKPPPLYSVLNPETSSDSPSAKSNGVRLVSARHEASQIAPRGSVSQISQIFSWR